MKNVKKDLVIKMFWKNYYLELLKSEYLNWKLYLWLQDKKADEYFSDITVNLPWLDIEWYNYIDYDFIECCFNSNIENLKKRLKENLDIKDFWKYMGYYYFTL